MSNLNCFSQLCPYCHPVSNISRGTVSNTKNFWLFQGLRWGLYIHLFIKIRNLYCTNRLDVYCVETKLVHPVNERVVMVVQMRSTEISICFQSKWCDSLHCTSLILHSLYVTVSTCLRLLATNVGCLMSLFTK